jgi:CheY-like chemotaxis protein
MCEIISEKPLWTPFQGIDYSEIYNRSIAGKPTIHVGYEHVTDKAHTESAHMHHRICGIIQNEFPDYLVIHQSINTEEMERSCKRRKPDVAILSATLPELDGMTLLDSIRYLLGKNIKVIVLYKGRKEKIRCELLSLSGVSFVPITSIKKGLQELLT